MRVLDSRGVIAVSRTRPKTKCSLDMINREPPEVPCLADEYWISFPKRIGMDVAHAAMDFY